MTHWMYFVLMALNAALACHWAAKGGWVIACCWLVGSLVNCALLGASIGGR